MRLNELRHIYEAEGPFATVYLEARSPSEDAKHQLRLRWDDLRSQLADAGAHDQALAALDEALTEEKATTVHSEGRVLVAGPGGLLLEEHFDAVKAGSGPGGGDRAVLGEPAELGPYVRERLRSVRMLVAIADQESAVLRRLVLSSSEVHREGQEETVEGTAIDSVHKPREGWLSHKSIQNTADEAAKRNLRDVAERLEKVAAAWKPDVVVVAGAVQGRKQLLDELPAGLSEVTDEVEAGGGIPSGGADEGTEDALSEELGTLARRITVDRAALHTDRYGEAEGDGRAVQGVEDIRRALMLGAVDTLLLRYGTRAEDEEQLLQDSAEVDAAVGLIGRDVVDDVAAVLRYQAPVDEVDA